MKGKIKTLMPDKASADTDTPTAAATAATASSCQSAA
jgi:hypothetical protein